MKFLVKLSIFLTLTIFSLSNSFAGSANLSFEYANKGNWREAINHAKKSKDPVVLKLVQSMKFTSNCPENNFEDMVAFLDKNPDWPQKNRILEIAEGLITNDSCKDKIVEWFSHHDPITDNGAKYYALSFAGRIKDKNKIEKIVKEGWIYGNFNQSEQKIFYNKYKSYLSEADHVKKIDYLLWNKDIKKASEIMPMVNAQYRAMMRAAIALIQDKPDGEKLFNNLSGEYKHHSIVLYSYLKKYEKQDATSKLAHLAASAHADEDHSKEWWALKAKFARDRMKQKDYNSAYQIAKHHHATCPKDASNAEFLAGWIALRYLGKKEAAKEHFLKMHRLVKMPISVAKASYWIGRCELAMGKKEEAHKWMREAAAFNQTFYGQLASLELGNKSITLPSKPTITNGHKEKVAKNELARAAKILLDNGKDYLALVYAKAALKHTKTDAEALVLVDYMRKTKKIRYTAELAKAASYHRIFLIHDAFPTPYKMSKSISDPTFAHSIIRQETLFDQYAVSNKDARGLMQIVPATARLISKSLKEKCHIDHLLTHPEYNMKLGSKYLKNLMEKYDGSYILAISNYNAGPTPVERWIETYGDPRKLKNLYDIIDWVENIPYYETRDYVQRVLENMQIYRAILGISREIKLAKDLGAKGK
ncbi:MAG: transglycosylase SLT domain-containing protein [Rickettsiaceae bacterium]|nr:transglycosylase SLT domain-containing protein [Rickettsiaceae bacterium]